MQEKEVDARREIKALKKDQEWLIDENTKEIEALKKEQYRLTVEKA